MTIEYEFVNTDTSLATLVFVFNARAQQGAQACDGTPVEEARFRYQACEFLNASQGAREYFNVGEGYHIVARQADASPTPSIAPSPPTPVLAGQRYLAFPGRDRMQVSRLGDAASDAVEVVTASPLVNAFKLAIEWYRGEARVGVTAPLPPSVTAVFQGGETLLFLPVSPDKLAQSYSVADLDGATRYRPPSFARQVKARFSERPGQEPGYSFSPPSAD